MSIIDDRRAELANAETHLREVVTDGDVDAVANAQRRVDDARNRLVFALAAEELDPQD